MEVELLRAGCLCGMLQKIRLILKRVAKQGFRFFVCFRMGPCIHARGIVATILVGGTDMKKHKGEKKKIPLSARNIC